MPKPGLKIRESLTGKGSAVDSSPLGEAGGGCKACARQAPPPEGFGEAAI
jgi:hypothetical protein